MRRRTAVSMLLAAVLASGACRSDDLRTRVSADEAFSSLCLHLLPVSFLGAPLLRGEQRETVVQALRADTVLLDDAGDEHHADQVRRILADLAKGEAPNEDLAVFLQEDVTDPQRDGILEVLEGLDGVLAVRLDQPTDGTAASFRVDLRAPEDFSSVAAAVAALPGVNSVNPVFGDAALGVQAISALVEECGERIAFSRQENE